MPSPCARSAKQDPDLARAWEEVGAPPPRSRPPGFASLVDIVLAQQVSTASYRAIAARLEAAAGAITPQSILALGEEGLRAVGFSRQKAAYARGIAEAVGEGRLDLDSLALMPDDVGPGRADQAEGRGAMDGGDLSDVLHASPGRACPRAIWRCAPPPGW